MSQNSLILTLAYKKKYRKPLSDDKLTLLELNNSKTGGNTDIILTPYAGYLSSGNAVVENLNVLSSPYVKEASSYYTGISFVGEVDPSTTYTVVHPFNKWRVSFYNTIDDVTAVGNVISTINAGSTAVSFTVPAEISSKCYAVILFDPGKTEHTYEWTEVKLVKN